MGFIRRPYKKKDGTECHRIEIRLKGFVVRKTYRTKSLAKREMQRIEAAIQDGRYKSQSAARVHDVNEMIDRFLQEVVPYQHRYFHQKVQLLSRWKLELGSLALSDLQSSHIAMVRNKLLAERTSKGELRTASTVNRYLASFSKVLNTAIKEWGWLEENPVSKIQKPPENPGRTRLLTIDEKTRLLEACRASRNPFLFPIVMVAIFTGMRSGEILNLRWKDIDFTQHAITLHRTKNGDCRIVPLTAEAADIFKKSPNYPGKPDTLVFKSPHQDSPISIRKPFHQALKNAHIENFRFHDLRHEAASLMAMNGTTQGELMAILGHKSSQMTHRYAHFHHTHLLRVMEKNNQKFLQQINRDHNT